MLFLLLILSRFTQDCGVFDRHCVRGLRILFSFITITSWLVGQRSFFAEGSAGGPSALRIFCGAWVCRLFTNLLDGARGVFCTVFDLDLWVVGLCSCLGDVGPLYGLWGWQFHNWRFSILVKLVSRASMTWLRTWVGTMGQFDALCKCYKHIRQYDTSSSGSVDCDRGVVHPEPYGLPCAFTISISLPTSLCVFGCRLLHEEDIPLTLPRLLFCSRLDAPLFGGDW